MHVIHCAALVSATTALITMAGASPSAAAVFQAAGVAGWSAGSDATMCFTVRSSGVTAGMATATGLVRTAGPIPDFDVPIELTGAMTVSAPNTVVSDVHPIASASGFRGVCVGGAGGTATGGTVTFSLDLYSPTDDYASVVTCTYSSSGPSCA